MLPIEPYNGRIKLVVKGNSIKARWHVSAKAWYGGRELWQAGRQEGEVTGRHDVHVRFTRQAAGHTLDGRGIDDAAQFRSPDL